MKPELLCPAGSRKSMRYAYAYGADAVYIGQPRYSLRVRENEFFKLAVIDEAVTEAHRQQKKVYIASNIAPHNAKVRSYLRDMEPVIAMKPDALIMSDPGLIMMVRERWPDVPVHLSVQANTVNFAAVKFWQKLGLERIILSRELSLEEIAEIRQECPDMELEVFVHGALCIAYSGRCLLSGYMANRDPNQGACTNACRWKYQATEAVQTEEGNYVPTGAEEQEGLKQEHSCCKEGEHDLPGKDKVFLLQEKMRPDEVMPAWEDEHGTYIMNSKDLRAIQHVRKLVELGIDSLKIEGRTKSHYYAARTAQAYRKAIDDAVAGQAFDESLMDSLDGLANRGYTDAFYERHRPNQLQNYDMGNSNQKSRQFVGELVEQRDGLGRVEVKNQFRVGDQLELMTPTSTVNFVLEQMKDKSGKDIELVSGSGQQVDILLPQKMDLDFGLLTVSR
ncbi:MAG: tRNA 5-hydroxyuridine modification protein YegQ [Myxococcales bacterium]|nr:MAG: tRNA 5-hydroxyuridine modification protein YegQ [Myxococcales bacterium]